MTMAGSVRVSGKEIRDWRIGADGRVTGKIHGSDEHEEGASFVTAPLVCVIARDGQLYKLAGASGK